MTSTRHPRLSTPKLAVVVVGLLFLLTLVALGGVVATRKDAAHSVSASSYRESITLWHLIRSGCNRSVQDREDSRRLLARSAIANQAVADDNVNTARVRRLRGLEAAAQRAAVTGLSEHVPPAFSCVRAFPKPPAPDGVKTLP